MARAAKKNGNGKTQTALGFEATLWAAADKLRSNMDAADYKHVVLGLIFLKFISDRFERQRAKVAATPHADPEDRDEYTSAAVFWVPKEARWAHIQASAPQPTIGEIVDEAMYAIERENGSLKDVLPKNYARADLDKSILAGVINLIAGIDMAPEQTKGGQDVLGRVYEYFLGQFAAAEGKKGGQFYTPSCIVQLLVEMLQPFKGRVYDPCCGSGGMFVQSERFVEEHEGRIGDISVYGQESNPQTWRLAKMNLAIRGIEANLGARAADSFHDDLHPDLKADFILANPPFNVSDWGAERRRNDLRWRYGAPPNGNANYAWIQHFVHHLSPHGHAGFVLANGSMSSNQSGEGEIRKALIEADLVDCLVAMPGQLFYTTQIPVCLWFLARDRSNGLLKDVRLRDRRGETLFIDARAMGTMENRTLRVLTPDDIERIAETYHAWREGRADYADVAGFCRSVKTAEIEAQGFVLTPGRYVGAAEVEEDGEPFEEAFARLSAELEAQTAEGRRLDDEIARQLRRLGA